jgi:hypothetical protein
MAAGGPRGEKEFLLKQPSKGTMMKYSRFLFAAVVAAAAVAANAEVGTHGDVGGTPQAAQAQGKTFVRPSWATKNVWSTSYNPLIGFQSGKSREQVRSELMSGREALLAYQGRSGMGGRAYAGTSRTGY